MGAEVANLGDDIRKTSAEFEEMGDQNKKYGAHIVFTHAQTELFLVIFLSCCLFMRGTEENGCSPASTINYHYSLLPLLFFLVLQLETLW